MVRNYPSAMVRWRAESYRDEGFLPEAMRNYLLRLGWGHGDEEFIPTDQSHRTGSIWMGLANPLPVLIQHKLTAVELRIYPSIR